jgi:predicted glycoside hydrolase/deacetylase ChbG (UPF0249 family)
MSRPRPVVLLTADDFAMTEGVSAGIEDLARRRLLSAAGAMVTTPHWAAHAPRLTALRDGIAAGLHLNLTLGAPLGPMPRLAPSGKLPAVGKLTLAALTRRVDAAEVEAEATRQLDAFESRVGHPPDYLDGHQHVHALPGVRDGILAAIARRTWPRRLLVRHPASKLSQRQASGIKSTILAGLSAGFASRARRAGLLVNDTFGGVTDFQPEAASRDITASLERPGRLHIAMCHPGFPDEELERLDPVTTRRRAEYDALLAMEGLSDRIWHPARPADGGMIDWRQELERTV